MLVVSRFPGQSIDVICGDVRVRFKVLRVSGDKVRVALQAPERVKILRSELVPMIPDDLE